MAWYLLLGRAMTEKCRQGVQGGCPIGLGIFRYSGRISTTGLFVLAMVMPRAGLAQVTVPAPREVPAGTLDYTPVNADVATQSGTFAPEVALEVLAGRNGQATNEQAIGAGSPGGEVG